MKQIMKLTIFVLLMVSIAACTKEQVGDTPDKLPVKIEEPAQEQGEEAFIAPFTGVELDEKAVQRPIVITINNEIKARPQSGISQADMVYEFITEGGTTRLLAVFQSALPEEVGPVRSARDYFLHVAKGLDAFYIAHGYSPGAQQMLQANYVDNINGMQHDGTLFKRSADRKPPHNSYISKGNILKAMEDTNAKTVIDKMPPYDFHASINDVKMDDMASTIAVRNGAGPRFLSTYTYDLDRGTYDRVSADVKTIDKNNDEAMEVANIIVIEATYDSIDEKDRQEVDLQSGGKAMLFQAGKMQEVVWENKNGIIVPMSQGAPAKLVPGKTWIHVLHTNSIDTNVTVTP